MGDADGREPRVPAPAPRDCLVHLVVFVPFMNTGWRNERQGANAPPAPVTPVDAPPADGSTPLSPELFDEDLRLWGYSDDVNAWLRENLPRRVGQDVVAAGVPADPPGDATCTWREELRLADAWSVGVDTVVLVHRLEAASDTTWEQVRVSATGSSMRQHLLRRAEALARRHRGMGGAGGAGPAAEGVSAPVASALWPQELLVVQVGEDVAGAGLDEVASALTGRGRALDVGPGPERAVLRLGAHPTVVHGRDGAEVRDALVRVVATQTAVWAAAVDLDHELGTLLRAGPSEARRLSLQELEQRSLHLLEWFERVQRFRADIDVVPLHLFELDKTLWMCLDEEWGLKAQLASLDMKLTALEHVYAHLTSAMATRQARFLNAVVLAVTTLSLATFWLTVWEFTQKRLDPFTWVSAFVAVAAVASSLALFFVVLRVSRRTTLGLLDRSRPTAGDPARREGS